MMHLKNLVHTTPIPGSDGWHTAVLEVTPEMAKDFLAQNDGNRRLRPGVVVRYAAIMRKGEWMTSPEALVFSKEGQILSAQHRLHSVIATGLPQKFLCIFGVPKDVVKVLDRGTMRRWGDAYGLDQKQEAVTTRLAETYYVATRVAITDADKARLWAVIEDSYEMQRAACGWHGKGMFPSAAARAAVVARLLNGDDEDYVLGSFRALALGRAAELPPMLANLCVKARSGEWSATDGASLVLARAWTVLDPKKRHLTRTPKIDVSAAAEEVRAVIETALSDGEAR